MRTFVKTLAVSTLLLTLSGCSVFYPNWGATSLPEPVSESETVVPEETTAQETPTETATPEETTTAEATKEPVVRKEVTVEIIMAVADPAAGVVTVVAQIPNLTEAGGKCIFKYLGNGVSKTKEVKAELLLYE